MNCARTPLAWLLATALVGGLAGCGPSGPPQSDAEATGEQTAFRFRSDTAERLNADSGWAGAVDESVTVDVEQPFRLRFETMRPAAAGGESRYRLQYRRNGGPWTNVVAADFPYPQVAEVTPRVSIISTSVYTHGAETRDLLPGSGAPFKPGAGVNLTERTPPVIGGGHHTEWEWPLVIRRYADGAVTNDTGDRFDFRMTDVAGPALEAEVHAALTVSVPPRLLGGTFVETPGRLGPWQAGNGDLYFIMEPAETWNLPMMVKSADGGSTWREIDGANRPVTGDLEGFASVQSGETVHMLHQTSEKVLYHSFRTSDHPERPDTWAVRDELIAEPGEPPVQVATLQVRSDGSVVAVYGGPEKIRYSVRSPGGEWSRSRVVDPDTPARLSGPQSVLGKGDVVHMAYTDGEGIAWYRRILPDDTLGPRRRVAEGLGTSEADVGSVLPLVYSPGSDSVVIIYRLATGQLWERRVSGGQVAEPVRVTDRRVVQNAVDSDQTGADAILLGDSIHVLFIEAKSGRIFHTRSDGPADWQPATLQKKGIQAQWLRGQPVRHADGTLVYGYVYDAGSDGGSGRNWYAEVVPDDR